MKHPDDAPPLDFPANLAVMGIMCAILRGCDVIASQMAKSAGTPDVKLAPMEAHIETAHRIFREIQRA